MKLLPFRCAALSALFAMAHALAADKPVMTWMLIDWPPVFNIVDGKPTDGTADILIKELMHEWPEVEHRFLTVVQARALSNLAGGYPACFPSLRITPEREKFAYFSVSSISAPVQVVVRSDRAYKLPKNSKGEVLPAALFDRPDLVGILNPYRSYSPLVDALLDMRSPRSGVLKVHPADSGSNTLSMLLMGRGDYTLEYDFLLAYQQQRNPELGRGVGFKSFPLAGYAQSLIGTACPRTEWGRAMVIKIDALMSKIANHPEYRKAKDRWMTLDTLRVQKEERDAFYRERAKPSDPSKYEPAPPAPVTATTP